MQMCIRDRFLRLLHALARNIAERGNIEFAFENMRKIRRTHKEQFADFFDAYVRCGVMLVDIRPRKVDISRIAGFHGFENMVPHMILAQDQ